MKHRLLYSILSIALVASACSREAEPVTIHRFEQLLFSTPANELQAALVQEQHTYNTPLLNVTPNDALFMEALQQFIDDPVVSRLYVITDSLYHDLGWLERELGEAMGRAREVCPEVDYKRFYTLITADFSNYANRVFCSDSDLAISIETYALGHVDEMQMFGVPSYLMNLCTRDHLLPDCMAAAARNHIVLPDGDLTFLDHAIAEGKALYFLDQVLPDTPDSLKIRYTSEQLDWIEENVGNVWGWLIQNQVLYSSDAAQLRNLIDDAPKTNAFGDGSAPRTSDYIGWQIVKAYMKKNGSSMSQLFAETNSRKILEASGWRPKS